VAYACTSVRTDPELVREWAGELGYEPVIFTATNRAGVPLYHTNVALWIGQQVAMVAREAIAPADRERVLARLVASGREVITISPAELERFAGNMLELGTWDEALGDSRVLVMSDSARRALRPEVFAQLSGCTDAVLAAPIPTAQFGSALVQARSSRTFPVDVPFGCGTGRVGVLALTVRTADATGLQRVQGVNVNVF